MITNEFSITTNQVLATWLGQKTLTNRLDPDQADHQSLPDQGLLCFNMEVQIIIYDSTLLNLTSKYFVPCTHVKVYLHNYSEWVELSMNIHEGKILWCTLTR